MFNRLLLLVISAATLFAMSPLSGHAADPTFSQDIAPIIFSNCVSCHRPGEVGPFPLQSFEDVSNRAQMVKAVTQSRYMPPWKAAPDFGEFAYNAGLTQEEIDLIAAWVDAGTPPGDPSLTPPLPTFQEGSQLGVPDLVLSMEEAWAIKDDFSDEYRNFVIPTGLTEDKIVAAIEFRPGNPKVVHHAIVYVDAEGEARSRDADDPGYGYTNFGGPGVDAAKFYEGYVPGRKVDFFPDGMGMELPAGADLILALHYAPSVTPETDQSYVNIFFAKEGPGEARIVYQEFVMSPFFIENGQPFIIPPNQVKTFTGRFRVPQDVSLMSIAPHQHLLGRSVKAYGVKPNGDTLPMVSIPDWDFNWQGSYRFKKLMHVPAGTELVYQATYDNTSNNPANPNSPPRTVRWGERTSDEMFLSSFQFLDYMPGDELIELETDGATTRAEEAAVSNTHNVRMQPNPARKHLQLSFDLPQAAAVSLEITDIRGAILLTPLQDRQFASGRQVVEIDASPLPPGTYYCRFQANDFSLAQRLIIVR